MAQRHEEGAFAFESKEKKTKIQFEWMEWNAAQTNVQKGVAYHSIATIQLLYRVKYCDWEFI